MHNKCRVVVFEAQKMLRMVSRNWCEAQLFKELDQCQQNHRRESTGKLLQNVSVWNMNASFLDLELLLKQANAQSQSSSCLQVQNQFVFWDTVGHVSNIHRTWTIQ